MLYQQSLFNHYIMIDRDMCNCNCNDMTDLHFSILNTILYYNIPFICLLSLSYSYYLVHNICIFQYFQYILHFLYIHLQIGLVCCDTRQAKTCRNIIKHMRNARNVSRIKKNQFIRNKGGSLLMPCADTGFFCFS